MTVTLGPAQHVGDSGLWQLPARVRLAGGVDLNTQVTMLIEGDGGTLYVDDPREHTSWQLLPRSAESDDLGLQRLARLRLDAHEAADDRARQAHPVV